MGNANSGRRPDPVGIKLLKGTAKAHKLPRMPRADETFDRPPFEIQMDAIASAEWERIVPLLRKTGLVSEAERGALIAVCQVWSRYCQTQERIRGQGLLMETAKGPALHPLLGVQDRALAHLFRLWSELGLTPSARARTVPLQGAEPDLKPGKWAGVL